MKELEPYEETFTRSFDNLLRICCAVIAGMLICLLLSACRTQYIPVEEVHTVHTTRTDSVVHHDSIFLHDSIMVRQAGDTVYYTRWRTQYRDRWRDRLITDTLIRKDTIQVPFPVERKLTAWEKNSLRLQGATATVITVVILALARWLRRRYKRT